MTRTMTLVFALAFAIGALALPGCEKKAEDAAPAAAAEGAKTPAAAAKPLDAAAKAGLAEADKADGAEDKVVHKCATCALKMDGSKEHSVSIEGYEVHACSADCKHMIEQDPGKVFTAFAPKGGK